MITSLFVGITAQAVLSTFEFRKGILVEDKFFFNYQKYLLSDPNRLVKNNYFRFDSFSESDSELKVDSRLISPILHTSNVTNRENVSLYPAFI